jgi:hypothetical protein
MKLPDMDFSVTEAAVSCVMLLMQLARACMISYYLDRIQTADFKSNVDKTGGLTNLMRVVYQDGEPTILIGKFILSL